MSVAPIAAASVALRAQVVSAAETELTAALGAQATVAATPAPRPLPTAAAPIRQGLDETKSAMASRQASLSPLLANLAHALSSAAGLQPAVRTAIAQVLTLQLPGGGPFTAETLRQAVAQSGLFLEARLAGRRPPSEPTRSDLKAALLALQGLLIPPASAAPAAPRPTTSPPPSREAALMGQAPAPATLPADPEAIVRQLHHETAQAVARQTLHQLASLPDGATTTWMFELPIATPQGAAVAQFEVERDPPEAAETEAAEPTQAWRARFSIDMEPLGPIHVHLRLGGERTAVAVWAEREDSLERLRSHAGDLVRALPADLVFYPGAPQRPVALSGQFVDRDI